MKFLIGVCLAFVGLSKISYAQNVTSNASEMKSEVPDGMNFTWYIGGVRSGLISPVGNASLGYQSLLNAKPNTLNIAIGSQAWYTGSTGTGNAAIGTRSLQNANSDFNTAVGYEALKQTTSGGNNTAVGYSALVTNLTGSGNTAIGSGADVTSGGFSNSTAIGYNAKVNASNKIRLGNAAITSLECQVALSVTSDARFKYDIKSNVPGLDFITRLRPVTYRFDIGSLDEFNRTGQIKKSASRDTHAILHSGFLAQEVEQAAIAIGFNFDGIHKPANNREHYTLAYSQFVVPLVKAVQEQQKEIEALDDKQKVLLEKLSEMGKVKAEMSSIRSELIKLSVKQ